jgi:acyl-CoA thioesterase-1
MKKAVVVVAVVLVALLGYGHLTLGPKVRKGKPQGENIICFGDSLTAGTGASTGMDYPSQLARMISQPVINAGLPGDTTAGALGRLGRDVPSRSPRFVLITLGGNDLTHGVDRDVFCRHLRTIVTRIQATGALVVVGGIEVPLRDRGYRDGYRKVARETGAILVPNVFQGILGRPDLMSDPIHPNSAGYTVMAELFSETIRPYL